MRPLKISSADLVHRARGRIKEIHSRDAIGLETEAHVVIVDLRDIRERQRDGFIPNSIHAPRGMIEFWIDPESPYFKQI
ncbi:MAG: rhodanese-like domain-containing protein, partial [Litorivicinaceae bacterium]